MIYIAKIWNNEQVVKFLSACYLKKLFKVKKYLKTH